MFLYKRICLLNKCVQGVWFILAFIIKVKCDTTKLMHDSEAECLASKVMKIPSSDMTFTAIVNINLMNLN